MTTTTPTPALADLDKIKTRRMFGSTFFDGLGQELALMALEKSVLSEKADALFGIDQLNEALVYEVVSLKASDFETLIALARRAAQPVAPVQDVLTIPTAIMEIACDHRLHDEYKRGHRDARHAAADLVLARADELKVLAAPSPQIAEVAELPSIDVNSLHNQMAYIAAYDPDELHGGDSPDGLRAASRLRAIITRARNAIAASRREAGGELSDAECDRIAGQVIERIAAEKHMHPQEVSTDIKGHWALRRALIRAGATTAPASAGQAAPAPPLAESLKGMTVSVDVSTCDDDGGHRIFAELTGETGSDGKTLLAVETSRNFAAQPAEGAGQAKCTGCDPAEGFCRDCREAESAGQAGQVAKHCQYPNCGCTSRATCNFNYDATESAGQAGQKAVAEVCSKYGDPEEFGERELVFDADAIQKLPYGTKLYANPGLFIAGVVDSGSEGPWCPFCASDDIKAIRNGDGDYYGQCSKCSACGPWSPSREGALAAWRAFPTERAAAPAEQPSAQKGDE